MTLSAITVRERTMLVLSAALTCAAAVSGRPLPVGAFTFGAVIALNFVRLGKVFRTRLVSRLCRCIPFAGAVIGVGPTSLRPGTAWSWLACLTVVAVWSAVASRRIAMNLSMAPHYAEVGAADRAAGMVPYVLAGPVQEYLHRGVLMAGLVPLIGPLAILVTTVTFIAEHVVAPGAPAQTTRRDLAAWLLLSVVFGSAVYFDSGAVYAAMVAHLLFNAPNIAVWARMPGRVTPVIEGEG